MMHHSQLRENQDNAHETTPNHPSLKDPTAVKVDDMVRETFTVPLEVAGETARNWIKTFPTSVYWSRIESWQKLPDDRICFTMVRLPTAD